MTSKNTLPKIVATCHECNKPLAAAEEQKIPMIRMSTTTYKSMGRYDLSACAGCKKKFVEACKSGDAERMPRN